MATATAAVQVSEPGSSRLGAWLRAAGRDLVYLGAVLAWSVVAFTVLVTGVAVTVSLLAFVVGLASWVGFVYVGRWTTKVDRTLAGWQQRTPMAAAYQRPAGPGVATFVKTLTTDPQTWRDLTWMAITSVVGFASGLVVTTVAGVSGAYVSMPLWYWAIGDPAAHHGLTDVGVFTVDSLGRAALVSMAGLALVPVVLVLARGLATLHARLAGRLLAPR